MVFTIQNHLDGIKGSLKRERRGVGKVASVANSLPNFPASPTEKFGHWEKILPRLSARIDKS